MPPLEERTEYPYQNIRTKNYQWGDGDKVSFRRCAAALIWQHWIVANDEIDLVVSIGPHCISLAHLAHLPALSFRNVTSIRRANVWTQLERVGQLPQQGQGRVRGICKGQNYNLLVAVIDDLLGNPLVQLLFVQLTIVLRMMALCSL